MIHKFIVMRRKRSEFCMAPDYWDGLKWSSSMNDASLINEESAIALLSTLREAGNSDYVYSYVEEGTRSSDLKDAFLNDLAKVMSKHGIVKDEWNELGYDESFQGKSLAIEGVGFIMESSNELFSELSSSFSPPSGSSIS